MKSLKFLTAISLLSLNLDSSLNAVITLEEELRDHVRISTKQINEINILEKKVTKEETSTKTLQFIKLRVKGTINDQAENKQFPLEGFQTPLNLSVGIAPSLSGCLGGAKKLQVGIQLEGYNFKIVENALSQSIKNIIQDERITFYVGKDNYGEKIKDFHGYMKFEDDFDLENYVPFVDENKNLVLAVTLDAMMAAREK